jgi:secondary thiamine-phosphate synthase enzyme
MCETTVTAFVRPNGTNRRAVPYYQSLLPLIDQYRHNRTGEACPERSRRDNADAHLKRQVMGREVVVAITDGRLDFGPWEQIFYGEFDGRRRKRVLVKIIRE